MLVDSGATSVFISPEMTNKLELTIKPAHTTIYSINSQVLKDSDNSCKVEFTTQYMLYYTLVIVEVYIVPLMAYDIILGIS